MDILWKIAGVGLLVVGAIIAFKLIASVLMFVVTVAFAGGLIYGGYRLLTR
jgi:hypothetical protein